MKKVSSVKSTLGFWLGVPVFCVALVVNPYLGCSESSESDFTYSETDMQRVVLGAWQGTAEVDGVSTPFTLTLEQASSKKKTQSIGAPSAHPQCGSRSFVKPASACIAETVMPVVGSLRAASPELNGLVEGYTVAYRTLDAVELHLDLESGLVLSGRIEKQALSGGALQGAGSKASDVSMTRP